MSKFRSRLVFALVTLIVVVLLCLGLLLGQMFKGFYVDTFEDHIEREAKLVAYIVKKDGFRSGDFPAEIEEISERVDSRVTILNPNGHVIIDTAWKSKKDAFIYSQKFKKLIDSLDAKTEGISAINDKNGVFYYAIPLNENNTLQGYLILSLSTGSLDQLNKEIWVLLMTSLGAAFIIILMLGSRITAEYAKPIEAATKVANELAKGNYNARTYENHPEETGLLSNSINILARNLEKMTAAQEMQQDRLTTLIENMGSGLILIDEKGYINLINRSYKRTFNVDPASYLYRLYYHAFDHKDVVDLVEEIFMTEMNVRRSLHLALNIERKHFDVYGAPIIGTNNEWKGIVLVFHDITELKKLEQMRKDFVANVSHELKTPITSIKGFTETLLDGAMDDEAIRKQFLTIINKESTRLQELIQDLLDLSKIEQNAFTLDMESLNISNLLDEVSLLLTGKAEEKGITLTCHVEKGVKILGDNHRLKQVFINLINNAINYTSSGGSVHVWLEHTEENVDIFIKDTGIGISESEIPRIFERFYRVDKSRSKNSGGTGLGLAIVKHLVEAHHGAITVFSRKNEGTTFTVALQKEPDLQMFNNQFKLT
jgi:two-component system, OmpR family, phosphate regulon sensor histidine kinase PhoR